MARPQTLGCHQWLTAALVAGEHRAAAAQRAPHARRRRYRVLWRAIARACTTQHVAPGMALSLPPLRRCCARASRCATRSASSSRSGCRPRTRWRWRWRRLRRCCRMGRRHRCYWRCPLRHRCCLAGPLRRRAARAAARATAARAGWRLRLRRTPSERAAAAAPTERRARPRRDAGGAPEASPGRTSRCPSQTRMLQVPPAARSWPRATWWPRLPTRRCALRTSPRRLPRWRSLRPAQGATVRRSC